MLTSVYDIAASREAIAPDAPANLLQIHPDLPNAWDAWDVDAFYRNTVIDITTADDIFLVTKESELAEVEVRRSFGASTVTQTISLHTRAKRVDINTEVDWHETEKILKAAFPLDVRAETSASETQFGHTRRATHTNTTWEAARFEICAHRFIHVAEPGWGAAIVNNSTYGHDVTRTVRADGGTTTTVRLSVLRAPRFPDPNADQGSHQFQYALVPGATTLDAVREGYRINLPTREIRGAGAVEPLVSVDNDAIVVETVKLADDRSGDVIVRLYEATGGRSAGTLQPGFAFATTTATDLLERALPDHEVITDGGSVKLNLRPFQILTLRLSR